MSLPRLPTTRSPTKILNSPYNHLIGLKMNILEQYVALGLLIFHGGGGHLKIRAKEWPSYW